MIILICKCDCNYQYLVYHENMSTLIFFAAIYEFA